MRLCLVRPEQNGQGERVFREPWEAQAFALALTLQQRGVFSWSEWAATLGEEISKAQAAGDPDTGETYYQHWLAALERLIAAKGLADAHDAGAHARSLAPRQRAHPARHADRAAAGRLRRLTSFDRGNHQTPRRTANGVRIEAVGDQEERCSLCEHLRGNSDWMNANSQNEISAPARATAATPL